MKIKIVSMDASHLDGMAALEKKCFSTPWSRDMLEEELYNDCAAYIVAENEEEQVVGYAGLQVIMDEGYITNVAVDPDCRRQHIAQQLLQVFFNFSEANQLSFITLEVRPGNTAAIALYEKFGFKEVGRRKNYYEKPKEDALLMTKFFKEAVEC